MNFVRGSQRSSGPQGGFSMVEVMIAVTTITVGLLGALAVYPQLRRISQMSQEKQLATAAMRSMLDEVRSAAWPDPANPSGANLFTTYSGATFTATGLTPLTPCVHTGTAHVGGDSGLITFLSEADASAAFGGINSDFDLDGSNNETDPPTGTFTVFPVRVEVRWMDRLTNEPRGATLNTIITNSSQ